MKKIEYVTNTSHFAVGNVTRYAITSHFLDYVTWCFVTNYVFDFTMTYPIMSRVFVWPSQMENLREKRGKKGYIPPM